MSTFLNTNKTFYDPVHGLSLIPRSEQGLEAFWQDPEKRQLNCVFALCDTIEFKRLHFLRQAGFCFQTYPSATHTRFGHSVGTCHLGRAALDQVDVKIDDRNRVKLGTWLKAVPANYGCKDLRDEFLLALLLHDVGHFPFSHILERNPHLIRANFPNHEEIAVDLILNEKKNKVVDAYLSSSMLAELPEIEMLRLGAMLQTWEENGALDRKALAFLICHTRRAELGQSINDSTLLSSLNLLAHLVSGVVDIDRLDHYIRDLYFTGTYLSSFNVFKLLNAVYLDATNGNVCIDEDAIPQAFNLLHSKEHLRRYVFEEPQNMAFNAMLNFCISAYVEAQELSEIQVKCGQPNAMENLLTLTDDQLLSELELVSVPKSIRKMICLIRLGQPYEFLALIKDDQLKKGQTLEQRAKYISSRIGINYLNDELPEFLFLLEDAKGKVSLLSMDKVFFKNHKGDVSPMREAVGFEHLVRHLSFESDEQDLRCWLFARPSLDDVKRAKLVASLSIS